MSQVIKTFLGVFLVMFLAITSSGILSAYMVVADAQDLHASMVNEVENSNFYPGVIANCFSQASVANCKLKVILYQNDYKEVVCTKSSEIPNDTSRVTSARLELTFPFQISFFGISQEHTFCAYAR